MLTLSEMIRDGLDGCLYKIVNAQSIFFDFFFNFQIFLEKIQTH